MLMTCDAKFRAFVKVAVYVVRNHRPGWLCPSSMNKMTGGSGILGEPSRISCSVAWSGCPGTGLKSTSG